MKSGASDPFADDETNQESERAVTPSSVDETTEPSDQTDDDTANEGTAVQTDETSADGEETGARTLSRDELPLILRRQKVKDERPEVHQLFVQSGTHEQAVDAERELEEMLGVDLSRTDAREAIYLAGMANLDEAASVLRRWGYDM